MKLLITFIAIFISLTLLCCSEDNTSEPPKNPTGKLVVKSDPSGARIFLMGTDTGKNTPDSLANLEPGTYNGFVYLQYFDTAYFSAIVYNNLTTTEELKLTDATPFIEFTWDYSTAYGGDSVKFSFQLNQDVLIDSVVVERPINTSGSYTEDRYFLNKQLFNMLDGNGNPANYFIPFTGSGEQYYPRIRNFNYWISVFGQKAHGTMATFHILYMIDV
jgi:hypothetical protein